MTSLLCPSPLLTDRQTSLLQSPFALSRPRPPQLYWPLAPLATLRQGFSTYPLGVEHPTVTELGGTKPLFCGTYFLQAGVLASLIAAALPLKIFLH